MAVSRKYLRREYIGLKYDMETVLDVLNETGDEFISDEDIKNVAANIKDKCESISKEFKFGEVSFSTTTPPMILDSIGLSDAEQGLVKCDCCGCMAISKTMCTVIVWTNVGNRKAGQKLYCVDCYEKYLDTLKEARCGICDKKREIGDEFFLGSSDRILRCSKCHKAYSNYFEDKIEKTFKCTVCGKEVTKALAMPLSSVNDGKSGRPKYICPDCSYRNNSHCTHNMGG